jgi:hypothetical protein
MACVSSPFTWELTLPCSRVLDGADKQHMSEMTYLDPENGRVSMIVTHAPPWYYGLGIQIRFQSTDADAQPGPSPTNNNGKNSGEDLSSPGLSSGAAAGIAIGATLLVLWVVGGAIGVCFFRRRARKRKQQQQQALASSPPSSLSAPYETDGQSLPASAVYKTEIAGLERPAELYPLHHEAAYGSQVHLAPQELGATDETGNGMVDLPPAYQSYELSSHPRAFGAPTPVYYHVGLEEHPQRQQSQRQQQFHVTGQSRVGTQSHGKWESSWGR